MDKSTYDCMAYIIRTLLDYGDDQLYENYKATNDISMLQYKKILHEKFPELIDEHGNAKEICTPYHMAPGLSARLLEFTDNCVEERKVILLAVLLQKMDIGLTEAVETEKTDTENTEGLNYNVKEQEIQILPRCTCSWAHNNKDSHCSNTLNNLLNHLYYIDIREFKRRTGCNVSHTILGSERFKNASVRGYFTIGLTPFSDDTSLLLNKYDTESGVREFQVTGLSNEESLIKRAECILHQAKDKDVDFLGFPEMLGSKLIIEKIHSLLADFSEDDKKQYPALVLCPTYWNNGKNVAVVLDQAGEIVATQCKQKAFEFEENNQYYREGLKPDKHVQIIHCDGLGRIGILICRDALERDYLQAMLELLKITLLMVPSYSTGSFDFAENLKTCAAYDCTVVWINTCCALPTEKKQPDDFSGFVQISGKRTTIRNGQFRHCFSKCRKVHDGEACRTCIDTKKIYFDA